MIYRIQGNAERRQGIFYEFNSEEEPLGEGGMGRVYRGLMVDQTTGSTRQVAIKQMFRDLPEQAYLRAKDEASIQLRNDNLVEMLGFIEVEGRSVLGEPVRDCYVVSELLDGVMLDDLMQGRVTNRYGATVPLAQTLYTDYQRDIYRFAITVVRNILSGLIALHDAGYVHRDIDPTNIMITSDGHVKLIDFGIAKVMRTKTTQSKALTVSGSFMGKPEYAAPELALGKSMEQDQTTDLYAMGILLYQCITGHPPFEGDASKVLHDQVHTKTPLGLIKNRSMREIIAKATEKERSRRYQSAAEFRVALEKLPLPLKDDSPLSFLDWKKVGLVAACVAGALVLGTAGYTLVNSFRDSGAERTAGGTEVAQTELVAEQQQELSPYDEAYQQLLDRTTAGQGLQTLQTLADGGDAEATFLLSRLCFQSNNPEDQPCFKDTELMRLNAGISVDNMKAHDLLEKAVELDGKNYKALYELGCDYYNTNERIVGFKRNTKYAIDLFNKALPLAVDAGDELYETLIRQKKNKLESRQ